jgi:D-xylulose reductase
MLFAATPPHDGTLVRYYPLPGDVAYKLPESLSFEDGAMVDTCIIYLLSSNITCHTR